MKKFYSLSLIVLASLSYAQVSLTALNTAYTQNFDGVGTALPTGFQVATNATSISLGYEKSAF